MDLDIMWNTFVDLMMSQTTEFQERDSGWALEQILYLEMNINKYSPMGGSSYIPSPKFVEKKRAVVNWGLLRYSHRKLHVHVNLLLPSEDCGENHLCNIDCGKCYYCWIEDLSRLVCSQISATEHKNISVTGANCIFITNAFEYIEETIVTTYNLERQMLVPFVVYADYESVLKAI
ncbi:hypothetical protein NQ317_012931 [Molorchus minor]|uniref:Uncharacterized protein n=1 Tax=Molorchus minor TaxID=1323400 RepID=A0ABQ9IQS1_9CUCU|nr:hypothetical protein NQ317_012931 [Molorchus minor]